jgi:peptidoglycan/LPS O-acetylase OafA/YrhL
VNYRPEIDGLRAIAVLPVILFHSGIGIFSGGYVGVDVFFVISGYLITTIILAELDKESFSITNFYERRARRILPVLFFIVLFCVPFALYVLLPDALVKFGHSLIAVPTFSSNVLFWSERGYFGTASEMKPLVHTWSLAVEEQFYLLLPLVLIVLSKYSRKWTGLFILFIIIISLCLSWYLTRLHFESAFYLPFARAWELMMGAAAAFYATHLLNFGKKYSIILSLFGLSLIFYAVLTFDHMTVFPGYAALIPVFGTFLFIIARPSNNLVVRVMSNPVLVNIGLVSYSLYLWHQPVFVLFRHLDMSKYIGGIGIPFTFLLAFLTYKYVETPFRSRTKFSRTSIFRYSFLASLVSIGLGVLLIVTDGFVTRYSQEDQKILTQFVGNANYNQKRFDELNLRAFDDDTKLRVLVVGDSYAKDLVNVMYEGGANDSIHFSTKQINSECGNLYTDQRFNEYIPQNKLFRCEAMGWYGDSKLKAIMLEADEVWLVSSWHSWVIGFLPETLTGLTTDFGVKVRVFESKTFGRISRDIALSIDPIKRPFYTQSAAPDVMAINKSLAKVIPVDSLVRVQSIFCGESTPDCSIFTPDGRLVSIDGGHLTKAGSAFFASDILEELSIVTGSDE